MTERKRILFVDDEPNLLRGLRRMLYPMSNEWEMAFMESGKAALAELASKPYDVVVTDMRMPVMDGAALLAEVRSSYPEISRIVLSGHSEWETVMRVIGPAHQYLSKPCNPETLKTRLTRTFKLREILGSEKLRKIVSGMSALPAMPLAYKCLVEELNSKESSLDTVAGIISRDIGLSAKILQLVNSEFFGLAQKISSTAEAVSYLGLETVRALVLGIDLFANPDKSPPPNSHFRSIWHHGLITAVLARHIVQVEAGSREIADEAFTAGMLHDLGKLIIAENLPEEYEQIIELCQADPQISPLDIERQVIGATHADVGAYLLGLWGLPDPVVEAVALHHTPSHCPDRSFTPVSAVHVADYLARTLPGGDDHEPCPCELDSNYLRELGLLEHLNDWRILCQVTLEERLARELVLDSSPL